MKKLVYTLCFLFMFVSVSFAGQVIKPSAGLVDTAIKDPTTGASARQDSSTDTLMSIDYAHHEIHSGSNFRVQAYDDVIPAVGSNGELAICFNVPDQSKEPHMIWEFVHEGDMTMKVLEDVTLTLSTGTNVTCKNSNRNSAKESVLGGVETGAIVANNITKNPTYSGGNTISLKRSYSTRNMGASGSRRAEVLLKTNEDYCLVLENNETSTQGGQIRLEWYKHSPRNQ